MAPANAFSDTKPSAVDSSGIVIQEQIAKNALVIPYACVDRINWVLNSTRVLTSTQYSKTRMLKKKCAMQSILAGHFVFGGVSFEQALGSSAAHMVSFV